MNDVIDDTGSPEAAVVRELDCTGLLCPLPVYQASKALAGLDPGEVLRVVCTDPGSLVDFPALARQAGHELVSATEEADTQIILLRKGGTS
jgi:tRNA 2-thiouridine synthesizing protein A